MIHIFEPFNSFKFSEQSFAQIKHTKQFDHIHKLIDILNCFFNLNGMNEAICSYASLFLTG